MELIKKMPVAVCGLSVSIAALGRLLQPRSDAIYYICGALSAAILVLLIIKIIFDFKHVQESFKNPIILGVFPTSTLTLQILCSYIKPFAEVLAVYTWYFAIIIHFCIIFLFMKRFVYKPKLQNVYPSWLIVFVAVAGGSITADVAEAWLFCRISLFVGFILYLLILPVVLYKMIKTRPLPEPVRPTLAILTAPMNFCIVGYFSSFESQISVLLYAALLVSVIFYIFVSVNMVFLLRLKFYPTYAAFTFPYVISATAFKAVNSFLMERGMDFFSFAPIISECLAVAIVSYVFIRYLVFMMTPEKSSFTP